MIVEEDEEMERRDMTLPRLQFSFFSQFQCNGRGCALPHCWCHHEE